MKKSHKRFRKTVTSRATEPKTAQKVRECNRGNGTEAQEEGNQDEADKDNKPDKLSLTQPIDPFLATSQECCSKQVAACPVLS